MKSINPNIHRQPKRVTPSVSSLVEGILRGDRVLLSQAITLVESTRTDHQIMAQQIIEACLPHAGKSVRVGITGTPGVGKSTFIEAFGTHFTGGIGSQFWRLTRRVRCRRAVFWAIKRE